jgi:hypothetical protein
MRWTALLCLSIAVASIPMAQAQNTFPNTGNVGIGTTSPRGALHILKPGIPPSGLPGPESGLLLGTSDIWGFKWLQSYGGILSLNPPRKQRRNRANSGNPSSGRKRCDPYPGQ